MSKYLSAWIAIAAALLIAGFSWWTYERHKAARDRHRVNCEAVAKSKNNLPKHLHVFGSGAPENGGTMWDIKVRRAGNHDVYILIKSINPTLIDGASSIFVRATAIERVYRTVRATQPMISFEPEISYGRISSDYPFNSDYRLPFYYPVMGSSEVIQADGKVPFLGRNTHLGGMLHAVDIAADIGSAVVAGRAGEVVFVIDEFPDLGCYLPELEGRSNIVIIRHDDGSEALYGHLMRGSIEVAPGERVGAGQLIARVGNSGMTSVPHLHVHVGGLTKNGYRTVPLLFEGCSGNVSAPKLGKSSCN